MEEGNILQTLIDPEHWHTLEYSNTLDLIGKSYFETLLIASGKHLCYPPLFLTREI